TPQAATRVGPRQAARPGPRSPSAPRGGQRRGDVLLGNRVEHAGRDGEGRRSPGRRAGARDAHGPAQLQGPEPGPALLSAPAVPGPAAVALSSVVAVARSTARHWKETKQRDR